MFKSLINKPHGLTRKDQELIKKGYAISPKYDGERCLLIITKDSSDILYSKKTIPFKTNQKMNKTILDCEDYKGVLHAFDLLYNDGKDIQNEKYSKRYSLLKKVVNKINNPKLKLKPVYFNSFNKVREIYENTKDIQIDGLIFTPDDKYRSIVFKWKPANELTIDVKFDNDGNVYTFSTLQDAERLNIPKQYLLDYKPNKVLVNLKLFNKNFYLKEIPKENHIIEVAFENGNLHFRRYRKDKDEPNYLWIVKETAELIRDPVNVLNQTGGDYKKYNEIIEVFNNSIDSELELRLGKFVDNRFKTGVSKEEFDHYLEEYKPEEPKIKIYKIRMTGDTKNRMIMDENFKILGYDLKRKSKYFDFPNENFRFSVAGEIFSTEDTFTKTDIKTDEFYRVKVMFIKEFKNWRLEMSKVYKIFEETDIKELIKDDPDTYEIEIEFKNKQINMSDIEEVISYIL